MNVSGDILDKSDENLCYSNTNNCQKFKALPPVRMGRSVVKVEQGAGLSQACFGELVVSIIRMMVFVKGQVPVPLSSEHFSTLINSVQVVSYKNTLQTAVDTLDAIFKNIIKEFKSKDLPLEVCLIFGPSSDFPKEIYRIVTPQNLTSHHSSNHVVDRQKKISQIIRDLMFSELQDTLHTPLPLTKMFVFLKKHKLDPDIDFDDELLFSDFFLPNDSFRIPKNCKQFILELDYDPKLSNCCNNMKIFSEETGLPNDEPADLKDSLEKLNINLNDFSNYSWLQSKAVFKGFKEPDSKK